MATVDCPERSCYRKTWAGPSIGNHRLAYDLMVRTEPLEFRLAGKGCQRDISVFLYRHLDIR